MQDIKALSLDELKETLRAWGEADYHANQVFGWIYKKLIFDFDRMSDLPQALREKLKKHFSSSSLTPQQAFRSRDGTEKFLFQLEDKNLIEAVVIPAQARVTGCISSQVGCKFGCSFCASGLLGFKRNLSSAEMLAEVLALSKNSHAGKLTHIVFMGTGEPLDNYDNVLKAVRIINAPWGLQIGARRITISSAGFSPGIERLAEERLQVELSISLHAADDATRSALMPINKRYPLAELIDCCRRYTEKTKRQVTFEYILIKGINSDLQNARNLGRILQNLKTCKVNIIPANPVRECGIEPANKLEMLLFRDTLVKAGIHVTLRRPRGADIEAACGQLRLRHAKD